MPMCWCLNASAKKFALEEPARSVELGYEKAISAITDANVTIHYGGHSVCHGLWPCAWIAITLGLGILTSVFTAIFVTRLLVVIWFDRARQRRLRCKMRLKLVPTVTNFDFFSRSKVWLGISGCSW